MLRKASLFLGAGAVGFAVDAATFFAATTVLGFGFVASRVLASAIAISMTWWINRSLAFRSGRLSSPIIEYLRYLAASATGALANLAVAYPISLYDQRFYHLPAYAIGATVGMVLNYLVYDRLVFSGRQGK